FVSPGDGQEFTGEPFTKREPQAGVEEGIVLGRRQDLRGGGLLRSAGGRQGVKALRGEKGYQRNHERILGGGDSVGRVLASAEEAAEKRYALRAGGVDLACIASMVSEVLGVKPEEVWAKRKYRRIGEARSQLCYWVVRELGVPMSSLAQRLGILIPSVSESVTRGLGIAETKGFALLITERPSSIPLHLHKKYVTVFMTQSTKRRRGMNIRQRTARIKCLLSILILTSCTTTAKLYEGPELPQHRIATVTMATSLGVVTVDGVRPEGLMPGLMARILKMLPGRHTITLFYASERAYSKSNQSVTFVAEAGKSYHIHALLFGLNWSPSITEITGR
ncbi:MAG: hypothetical protein L7F78_15670, partial [Syntrophales bacterium LBB04]|nr:hypothetical protein [Syntrophales bacterium LBB04]